jgi:cysteine desulfurase
MIYLDYNATMPLRPEILSELTANLMINPLNASSVHSYGRKAKIILEKAREHIKDLVNADEQYQVIFTSSGTEANNMAIRCLGGFPVLTSCIEHHSILSPVGEGSLEVDKNGVACLASLEKILHAHNKPALVSLMLANNEIGVIQPVEQAAKIVHKYNGIIHTDASQAAGKISVDIKKLGVDMMTLSAHKIGGMLGAGALVFKKNLALTPLILGGGQEFRLRSGTHNIPAIYAFGRAAQLASHQLEAYRDISKLRDFLEEELLKICSTCIIFGKDVPRLPNTSSITMPGVSNETQVINFDLHGICVSAGAACSSGKVGLPYVQMNMGYPEKKGREAIRISLGKDTTKTEILKFINCWQELYHRKECAA